MISVGLDVHIRNSFACAKDAEGRVLVRGRCAGIELTVEVLDARRLRIIAESVVKCDRRDAAVLCDLARTNFKLPACYVPDDEIFQLRERLRARADLVRMRLPMDRGFESAEGIAGIRDSKRRTYNGLGIEDRAMNRGASSKSHPAGRDLD